MEFALPPGASFKAQGYMTFNPTDKPNADIAVVLNRKHLHGTWKEWIEVLGTNPGFGTQC